MNKKIVSVVLASSIISGCAAGPSYKAAPSAKITKAYTREQIASPAGKQVGGAVVSGIIGGLLGPLGAIVTAIGNSQTQKITVTKYWKSFSNTRMVGVVVEDVSKKRINEYLDNPRWFQNLPTKAQMPAHFSVDFGSGNLLMLPVQIGVMPKIGDVVEVYAPPNAWTLVNQKADFGGLPQITKIRCNFQDIACINGPENEPGIVEHLGVPSAE